jgi:hypothetical protein
MLLGLAVAFFASLWGLAVDEPPDLRLPAASGLGLGALAAFVHAAARVMVLYREARSGGRAAED